MTQHPEHLTDSPGARVDVLSEVLRNIRLTGALYYRVSTSSPWPAIRVPVGRALASVFGERTRTVVSYHVLLEGSCWTGLEVGDPIRLLPGDVIVYPRGDPYFLSWDRPAGLPSADPTELEGLLESVRSGAAAPAFSFGDGPDRTSFVCGFLGCGPEPFDPVLSSLPRVLHVDRTDVRLDQLVGLALTEVDGAPGTATVRERLSESMFLETLRRHLSTSEELGWVAGVGDPVAGQALVLIHEDVRRQWTLNSLSTAVGVSRSVLADRFVRAVGRPPMRYLAHVRLQLAGRLLTDGSATVASVAHDVGYGSEAAFSRAFKRATGTAPGAWRLGAGQSPSAAG